MNKYDWIAIALTVLLVALFFVCAAVQTAKTAETVCVHDWARAGVRLTILHAGAEPVQVAGLEEMLVFAGEDTLEWYGLGYYRKSDLAPYQMQYCTRCGLLRIVREEK